MLKRIKRKTFNRIFIVSNIIAESDDKIVKLILNNKEVVEEVVNDELFKIKSLKNFSEFYDEIKG